MASKTFRSSQKKPEIRSFTYFIPAPPSRKSGYRDKEFDKILNGILHSGFQLLELKAVPVPSGVFIFTLLKPLHKKAAKLDANLDLQDHFKLEHKSSIPDFELEDEND